MRSLTVADGGGPVAQPATDTASTTSDADEFIRCTLRAKVVLNMAVMACTCDITLHRSQNITGSTLFFEDAEVK